MNCSGMSAPWSWTWRPRWKTRQCGVHGMTTQRMRKQLKLSWQRNRCFILKRRWLRGGQKASCGLARF
eukprot:1012218-Amphidinium_carterae.1